MGWFVVTVVIPLVAPVVLLAVFWLLPLPAAVGPQLRLLTPIKDGQLCWGAMGYCVSALYEMAEPGASGRRLDAAISGWVNGWFIMLLVLCAFLAAGGSVFSTSLSVPAGVKWYRHYVTMLASGFLTLLAAGSYTVVHFHVSGS